ncbi:hypothetical protein V1523DRAFT_422422 [Lipomyces doorenjongii]
MASNSPVRSSARTPTLTIMPAPVSRSSTAQSSATSPQSASGQMCGESGDVNRRDSMELEQMMPRKRVAIDIADDVDRVEGTEVVDPVIASTTAAHTLQATIQTKPVPEAEAMNVGEFSDGERSPQGAAYGSAASSETFVLEVIEDSEPLTTIERLILTMSNAGNDEEPLSIEACIFEARRTLQNDDPRDWLIALNEYLQKFVSLDEPHRDELWASGAAFFTQLPQIVSDFWSRTQPLSYRFWNEGGEQLIIARGGHE